ncbi:DUF6588 family protein [Carboxylicivirga linearis]|uniref:Outer membrane protein beta-barrel domain-containing protein n=1 Tax=Carboxylicivirga linearis TaxID=1628157 RepID=A0ABS5JZB7_9BACT|nr:DUF6588 family protein [Carboxylicivirga linearis]MBS2100206.1 hypothetical protein [Carboxylicivirga linearis]
MKKNLIYVATAFLLITTSINAQKNLPIDLLKGGMHDANLIGKEYLRPYGEMLGVNLNSGWYNSAKVHKLAGFDITISGTYTTAPSSKESFDVSKLSLEQLQAMNGQTIAPTMAGDKAREIAFAHQDVPQQELVTLNGSGMNTFVSPMVSGAVGLPFHTEIMGRFMPRVEYGDYGKAYMWGLGLKHSLKDYIPFIKRIPVLQVSALAAYTHFESKLGISGSVGSGNLETSADAYTGRLLIGANLPVVAFYSGIGYGNTKSTFDVVGDFNVGPTNEPETNPISLDYSTGNFDFNVGMRIRLAIFSIHADYTVGDYSAITAGVGINFR